MSQLTTVSAFSAACTLDAGAALLTLPDYQRIRLYGADCNQSALVVRTTLYFCCYFVGDV